MSSHRKDSVRPQRKTAPSLSSGTGGGLRHVALIDAQAERGKSTQGVLNELPGIESSLHVDAAVVPSGTDIAVVALDADVAASERVLGELRRAVRPRIEILAFGDGIDCWPLRARCRLLLAGAGCVLDSTRPDFAVRLQQQVRQWLDAAERRWRETTQLLATVRELGFIGQSPVMLGVYRWVLKVSALTTLPILITGETGTGKELVAQAIWKLDPKRRERPFVAVNCAGVAGELSESEFFGHERGAFTGAEQQRAGLFRAAHGGVLFLDEVGELSPPQQAKLLRVLQEGRVRGIGADREVSVDVRVLAATNRDLSECVRRAEFRQDLYQRLRVLHVHLPPLRERPEDVEPLIDHFLNQHADLVHGQAPAAGADFVQALMQADLPGNVRELGNLIRQALFLREGAAPLGLADLPRELLAGLAGSDQPPPSESQTAEALRPAGLLPDPHALLAQHEWNLARAVSHCEKLLLAAALERTRGNQSEAARLLGITARSVYNKLRRHGRRSHEPEA